MSQNSIVPKETIYNGPPIPAKETVYSGPAPVKTETVYNGNGIADAAARPSQETVGGGREETVYGGSVAGEWGKETVFDPAKHIAKRIDTSIAHAATRKTIQRASLRFFIIGGLSLVEALLFWSHPPLGYSAAMIAVIFLTIGAYAIRMSRTAFLAAMIVYGLQTASYLVVGFTNELGFVFVARPMILKCLVLYNLYRNYGLLTDLHELENA